MITGKRIFITGCGGMLGQAMYERLSNKNRLYCTDIDDSEEWVTYCDVRELDELRHCADNFNPDYIFHLAALTDLEYCEKNPEEAMKTNWIGTQNAVIVANELNIPIVYISTGCTFGDGKDNYNDYDEQHPINQYAMSKYLGEEYARQHAKRFIVARAVWTIAGGLTKGKKFFLNKIFEQIKANATEIFTVDDKFATPTYGPDMCRQIDMLLEQELWGSYNITCNGITTRYDMAHYFVHYLGLSDKVKVTAVRSDHFATQYSATRPSSEVLINTQLNLRGINIMRDWRECLKEYVEKEYKGRL